MSTSRSNIAASLPRTRPSNIPPQPTIGATSITTEGIEGRTSSTRNRTSVRSGQVTSSVSSLRARTSPSQANRSDIPSSQAISTAGEGTESSTTSGIVSEVVGLSTRSHRTQPSTGVTVPGTRRTTRSIEPSTTQLTTPVEVIDQPKEVTLPARRSVRSSVQSGEGTLPVRRRGVQQPESTEVTSTRPPAQPRNVPLTQSLQQPTLRTTIVQPSTTPESIPIPNQHLMEEQEPITQVQQVRLPQSLLPQQATITTTRSSAAVVESPPVHTPPIIRVDYTNELRRFLSGLLSTVVSNPDQRDQLLSPENMEEWKKAFTHITYTANYPDQAHYEAYEAIGDKIADITFLAYVSNTHPGLGQEQLSEFRMHYMSKQAGGQSDLAERMKLHNYVRLGVGRNGQVTPLTTKIIGDLFESLFGVLFELGERIHRGAGFIYCSKLMEYIFQDQKLEEEKGHQHPTTIFSQNIPVQATYTTLESGMIKSDLRFDPQKNTYARLRQASKYTSRHRLPNPYQRVADIPPAQVIGSGIALTREAASRNAHASAVTYLRQTYNLTLVDIENITKIGDYVKYADQIEKINSLLNGSTVERLKNVDIDEATKDATMMLYVRNIDGSIIPYDFLPYEIMEKGRGDESTNQNQIIKERLLQMVIDNLTAQSTVSEVIID